MELLETASPRVSQLSPSRCFESHSSDLSGHKISDRKFRKWHPPTRSGDCNTGSLIACMWFSGSTCSADLSALISRLTGALDNLPKSHRLGQRRVSAGESTTSSAVTSE
jgi:hypothetical protein